MAVKSNIGDPSACSIFPNVFKYLFSLTKNVSSKISSISLTAPPINFLNERTTERKKEQRDETRKGGVSPISLARQNDMRHISFIIAHILSLAVRIETSVHRLVRTTYFMYLYTCEIFCMLGRFIMLVGHIFDCVWWPKHGHNFSRHPLNMNGDHIQYVYQGLVGAEMSLFSWSWVVWWLGFPRRVDKSSRGTNNNWFEQRLWTNNCWTKSNDTGETQLELKYRMWVSALSFLLMEQLLWRQISPLLLMKLRSWRKQQLLCC